MAVGDTVSESIEIAASPERVYEALADVSRMPDWSPELHSVSVPNRGPLVAGQKFAGNNRKGVQMWRTTSTVVVARPPRLFGIEVTALGFPVARWLYEVEPTATGSRVIETWTDTRAGALGLSMRTVGFLATGVWNRGHHNSDGMRLTLQALKKDLESTGAGSKGKAHA